MSRNDKAPVRVQEKCHQERSFEMKASCSTCEKLIFLLAVKIPKYAF